MGWRRARGGCGWAALCEMRVPRPTACWPAGRRPPGARDRGRYSVLATFPPVSARSMAGVHEKTAFGCPAAARDHLVTEEVLVDDGGERAAVPDRRDAPDGEAGFVPHEFRARACRAARRGAPPPCRGRPGSLRSPRPARRDHLFGPGTPVTWRSGRPRSRSPLRPPRRCGRSFRARVPQSRSRAQGAHPGHAGQRASAPCLRRCQREGLAGKRHLPLRPSPRPPLLDTSDPPLVHPGCQRCESGRSGILLAGEGRADHAQ